MTTTGSSTADAQPAPRVQQALRNLHLRARRVAALHRLALISRLLLALAFVPTALVKVQGLRFTTISVSTPIGAFFEGLYQSGVYWRFIGVSQLVAGMLLLLPVTSTLGALLFLPIILNIFVITVSLQFGATQFVTGMMLLANLFLLCWDYHRFATILWDARAAYDVPPAPVFLPLERIGFGVGTVGAMGLLFSTRGLVGAGTLRTVLLACAALCAMGAAMVVAGWIRVARRTHRSAAAVPTA